MRIHWSHRFRDELRREYQFLHAKNPRAAREVRQRIVTTIRRLGRFPQSGRSWRLAGAMELVIPGSHYIVIYEIGNDAVHVLALFHTSRRPREIH